MSMLSVAAALVAAVAVVSAASDVTVLTTATFKSTIDAGPALVEFYAPWCGHCKHLEPIYDKLATEVKGRGVTIAKVDCTVEKALQTEQGIRGFPTLKLFKNGQVIDYRGARDVAAFSAFLETNGVLGPAAPVVKPHLRYFETRGRAELLRLILEEAGVAYDDTRLTWDQWLATEKPNVERYAFAQAPQLTIDGVDLVQSGAIARYLGRKYGLYGAADNNLQQTQIDVVFGGFEDLRQKYSTLVYGSDFAAKRGEFEDKVLPTWLPHFERLLTKAGGAFFVGGKLSIADLEGFEVLSTIWEFKPSAFDAYPALTAWLKAIIARPNINAYLKSSRRPQYAHGASAFFNNVANPGQPLPL